MLHLTKDEMLAELKAAEEAAETNGGEWECQFDAFMAVRSTVDGLIDEDADFHAFASLLEVWVEQADRANELGRWVTDRKAYDALVERLEDERLLVRNHTDYGTDDELYTPGELDSLAEAWWDWHYNG